MGTSHSKFYRTQKQNDIHQPPPRPTAPYGAYQPYAPQYGQMPGYGQNYQQQPQGFIPQGMYGQGANLPPGQLSWMDQDKRPRKSKKKSRRRESERFVGGFAAADSDAPRRSEAPSRRTRSESQHRPMPMAMPEPVIPIYPRDEPPVTMPEPVIPTAAEMARQASAHRPPSPPYPPMPTRQPNVHNSHGDRDGQHRRESQRHRYDTPPPVEGTLADAIRPMSPADRAVFGPSGQRPRTPLRNPLPPPPRDLYEMSPYRSLLTLPQTTALLTATFGAQAGAGVNRANTIVVHPNGVVPAQPAADVKRGKSMKGLFRAFSKKEKKPEPVKEVQFVPVFVTKPDDANGIQNHSMSQLPHSFQPQPADLTRSMSRHSRQPGVASIYPTRSRHSSHSSHSSEPISPIPPNSRNPPVVRFDQDGYYNCFMNHSPHHVTYQQKTYPTALHLHEAFKFIGYRDDIAEEVRTKDLWDVYPFASQFQDEIRPDWNDTYLHFMEKVLFRKFTQHPDLRQMLLETRNADLVYADPSDSFWGCGPNNRGANELGKALVRVREKILNDDNL